MFTMLKTKRNLEQKILYLSFELQKKEQENHFKMANEHQSHKLQIDAATEKFEREKKYWIEDRKRLEEELKRTSHIKLEETVILLKLESSQKTKQLELDHSRDLLKLKQESDAAVMTKEKELYSKFYADMTEALAKLHTEGNASTKFIQEMALGMIDKIPQNHVQIKTITASE